eukprot:3644407-Pyramimonas_sp.AAC.1
MGATSGSTSRSACCVSCHSSHQPSWRRRSSQGGTREAPRARCAACNMVFLHGPRWVLELIPLVCDATDSSSTASALRCVQRFFMCLRFSLLGWQPGPARG